MPIALSVIVPCYNVEPWVGRCLDSLLDQGIDDMEIICVNDGSKDSTLAILRDYEERYPTTVRVIDQPNGGVSAARNAALDVARGTYLTFVDADDTVPAGAYRKVMAQIGENNIDWVLTNFRNVKLDGTISDVSVTGDVEIGKSEEVAANVMLSCFYVSFAKFFNREIIAQNRLKFPTKKKFGEDALFNMQYLVLTHKILLCSVVTYNYLMRPETAARRFQGDDVLQTIEQLRTMRFNYFIDRHDMEQMRYDINRDAAFMYLFAIYSIYRCKGVKGKYGWLKKYWHAACKGDPQWTRQLNSGVPRLAGIIGRLSLPALHVMLSSIFTLDKIRR